MDGDDHARQRRRLVIFLATVAICAAAAGRGRAPGHVNVLEFDDCGGAAWCPRMMRMPPGPFMMGSPAGRARTVRRRGAAASRRDQESVCAWEVRRHARAVRGVRGRDASRAGARLCVGGCASVAAGRPEGLVARSRFPARRHASCRLRQLQRGGRLRPLAQREDGTGLSAADRGRMGVCRLGVAQRPAAAGYRPRARELRRRHVLRAACLGARSLVVHVAGRFVSRRRVRALRHHGQRLAVDGGLLRGVLRTARRRTARRAWRRPATIACCGAAPGATLRRFSGPRRGTGRPRRATRARTITAAASDSGSRGRCETIGLFGSGRSAAW